MSNLVIIIEEFTSVLYDLHINVITLIHIHLSCHYKDNYYWFNWPELTRDLDSGFNENVNRVRIRFWNRFKHYSKSIYMFQFLVLSPLKVK